MRFLRLSTPQALWLGAASAALLVAALTFDIVDGRRKELAYARVQLEQHNRMLAEHVLRTFDSIEVLLDELKIGLSERERWTDWNAATGHQFLKSRLSRSLPQIRHLLLFDATGAQRHTSFAESPPSISIADRPYFREISGGAERSRFGPYIGRNSNRVTYAFARRLTLGNGAFAGALVVAIEPNYLEQFCSATRPDDDYEAAVVNGDGQMIAFCHPATKASAPASELTNFRHALAGGSFSDLALSDNRSIKESRDFLLALEPIPGYPDLRVLTVAPKTRILANWRHHAQQSIAAALIGFLLLAFSALIIRKQFQQQLKLTRELRENRDTLEIRIREATREIDARRSEAERVADAKSRFFAAASHDLRQPLHALQLFIGDLARTVNGPEQRVLIQRIESAASAMAGQLRSLLELSRLDMANVTPQRSQIPVAELFNQLVSTYSASADAGGVRLVSHPCSVTIESDPALLLRLIGNLVDNAIKFSPGGTVMIAARWRANAVRIEVRDNGSGIDGEHLQSIYEEYFQIGNTAREAGAGLGLGLAIAHRIARLLGTSIDLRSTPGRGTTFAITLPCVLGSRPATGDTASDANAEPMLVVLGDAIDFPARARQWGYRVTIAENVSATWRLLEAGKAVPVVVMRGSCQLDGELQSLLRQHRGVVITDAECDIPTLGAYHLREPIKPARLRALLRSLH